MQREFLYFTVLFLFGLLLRPALSQLFDGSDGNGSNSSDVFVVIDYDSSGSGAPSSVLTPASSVSSAAVAAPTRGSGSGSGIEPTSVLTPASSVSSATVAALTRGSGSGMEPTSVPTPFARAQCSIFEEGLLGSTSAASSMGLIRDAIAAGIGEGATIIVQVHASNIVCLTGGRDRYMYTGVSVVVNYTCSGAADPACNGNPILSQFDFGCVTGSLWGASVGGSADSIITTPPTGSLSTTLRTDCGLCLSPARFGFGAVTDNDQHCGCKQYSR